MTVLLRRFHASALVVLVVSMLVFLCGTRLFAQTPTPERIVSPVRTDLPGRTVWAFATTGTGTNITTFAATDKGLYKSSGGAWSLTSLDKQSVYAVKSRRVGNVTTLLVGTDKGVLRSTDGGNTWASPEVTTGTVSTSNIVSLKKVFDIEIVQPGNGNGNGNGSTNGASGVWFVATEKGVYRSNNDGRSWSLVNIDRTADNNEVRGITTDGNTIIVNLWKEGLWRSTNNGNSWTKLSIAGETALCRAVHVHPTTNSTVWLAGSVSGNIWRSVNAGASWTQVYQGTSAARAASPSTLTQAGIDAFASWQRNDERYTYTYCFAATPFGIAFSLNDGAQWSLTRTSGTKAVTLTAWNNRLYAGREQEQANIVAFKSDAMLQAGDDSYNEYDIVCGSRGEGQARNCGGSGGSGGTPTGGTGGPIVPFPTLRINGITPNPIDLPGYSQQLTIRGQELHHSGTAVEFSSDTAFTGAQAQPNVSFSPTQLTFTLGTVFSDGIYWFRVRNGGGTSNREPLAAGMGVFARYAQIAPAGAQSGSPITMTVSGVGIRALAWVSTRVLIDGVEPNGITYTRRNDTSLVATFTAPSAGDRVVTLRNSVAGGSTFVSNSLIWTVLPSVPSLTNISPTTALAGQTVTFRATGNNLSGSAELLLNDGLVSGIQYGLRNSTELNATFPAPAAGSYTAKIRVVEQTTQTSLPFTVTNPQASISSVTSQQSTIIAGQSANITVNGSYFLPGVSQVSLSNGSAVSITPTISGSGTITFTFTPTIGGTYTVTVLNPGTNAATGSFTVLTPPAAPTIASLSTSVLDAGSAQQTISVWGTNFQPNSKVLVGSDSTTVTTQYISSTQLSATIPAAKFVQPNQTLNISVATPPFYGLTIGQSSPQALYVIYPQPTLTNISPNALPARSIDTYQQLTFTGSSFYPGTQILWDYNTANLSTLPFSGTVNNNVGTATLNLTPAFASTPRAVKIVISNPGYQPQNGPVFPARSTTSTPLDFTINTIKPILTSVSPRQIVWNGTPFDQIVSASGTNFFSSSRLIVVSEGSRELSPVANQDGAGTLRITGLGTFLLKVKNPAVISGGQEFTSDFTDTVRVVNPAPSILNASPSSFALNAVPASITLQGQAFMSGMTATIAGLPATVVPSAQTSVTLQFSSQTQQALASLGAGAYNIVLTNPAPSLGTGATLVTVYNPQMSSFTISPSPFTLSVPTFPQTLTLSAGAGSAFAPDATVNIGGNAISNASITRTSPSQISVVVPVQWMTPAGTFSVVVSNPNVTPGQSATATTSWQVRNPQPIVSVVNTVPTTVYADGSPVNVIIFGSQFMPGATVTVRGFVLAQTSFTNSRIDATIPAGALDSAGTFPAVVTNTNSGGAAQTQPLLTVLAPRPRLTTLGQQTLTLGANNGQPLVLNMNGSGFVRGSRFVWNVSTNGASGAQSSITTNYTNSNTLTATIPANLLTQAGIYRVAVVNDSFTGLGGGVSDTLTFTVNNPQASITTLQPSNLLPRFAVSAPLTFIGSDFITGARLLVTGLNNVVDTFTTQVQSATQLTATLPASLLDSAATLTLRILNPTPTVNVSNGVFAYVVNPRPRLSSLSQTSTLTGLPSLTLTASGSQFMDGAVGYASTNGANGVAMQTVVNNTGSLTLTVPASALSVAGTVLITVQNPLPRVQPDVSDTLMLTVNNPLPVLDSATSTITVSTQATTVQLYGANFILASSVKENGGGRTESTLSSNRLSQTQMTATVPATLTDVAGTLRLTVENPTPGGGRSQSVNVAVVHPIPVAQRITPSVVTMSASDVNIVITGDRFVNTADVLVNGQTVTVTQRTPTRLTATVPAALLATRGAYNVVVRNPQTVGNDGGTSAPLTLTVNTPQPLVTTIDLNGSPNQVPLDTVDVPLTVNGSRFQDSAIVRIVPPSGGAGTVIPTQSIVGNNITALIPASALTVGGVYSVVVENLAPTDAPSLPVTFAVVNPVPQMDSISTNGATPTVVAASTNPQTITVYGQKCTPTSVVKWRGQNLVTTFVNRNTLTAVLPSALQIRGAVGAITVFTPTDGVVLNGTPVGGGTGSAPGLAGVLTVTHGVPALTATAPATLLRDAWSASALPSLTLNGNLIASTASVRVQSTGNMNSVDTVLTPTSVNANGLSLVVTVPRSVVVTAGTFALTITNPPAFPSAAYSNDGGTSASVNLTVQNPTPALGSLAPLALAAASPNTLLTVNGSNLTRETQVFVNGVLAPRTIVNATQFTTTLPASLFTLSGFVRVQALNPTPSVSGAPAGDSSNTLSLEVYNPVPTLTTANPVFAPIGGRAAADSVTITLVGTNFVRNSVARIATTAAGAPTLDLPTTFVATTTLTVRMLPADFKAQAYNMTVFNPLPRGGVSVARRFTVTNPLPVLTALLPNSTTATGKVWTLRTVGNFFTSTSQISYNKVLQSLVNTTYIPNALTPSTQDTLLVKLAAVPVGDTTFPVVVYNPPTGGVGGGASDTLRLAVGLPAPTITSLSPATTTATFGDRNRAWTLTVNGTLFDDAAQVLVNGVAVPTYFVSTTRLRAVLPDALQSAQARRTVQVRNTPVLLSNLTTLTVQNPAPVLTTLTPSTVTAGRDTTLVLAGDRFAPDATVRVVFGGVTTVLTPSRRDSVNSVTVPLPANLITAQGSYSVQIINKGLQPTMVPPDTTVLGGGLDALTLTVQHDALAIVEYIGVDTLVNAGGNMPAFTVRFRDRVQNLVDNDGAIVYYASTTGSVASYWSLTRTSLGTYRTPVTPFPQAESYRLWVDTSAYGALAVVGANRFRVQPLADSIVTFTGLETRTYVAAGDTLPSFTAAIVDKLGNPTDNSSLRFSYARSAAVGVIAAAPASSATVRAARLQTGLYRIESTVATIAGVYTYSLAGIPTHVGQRTVEVMPRTPASVDVVNVKEIVVAGQKQTAVQVTYRDRYGNLTDSLAPTQNRLWYSNSTDATVSSTESLTVSETLTQRVYTKTGVPLSGFPYRGIYDASNAVTFPAAGKYSLAVDGITTTTGTTAFEVVPNVDFRVVFAGVPDTLTAGDSLRNVVVRYFDASGNPTDNGIGRVLYTRAGGSSTASVSMVRVDEGVYALNATQATLTGTYTMTVSGIATVNYQGNRTFVMRSQIPISAVVTISTGAMTSKGANVNLTVTFRDVYGNGTDAPSVALLANQQIITSQATFSLRKTGTVGTFVTTAVVTQPGEYLVVLSTTRPAEQGGGSVNVGTGTTTPHFNINPGLALKATFFNVPLAWGVGELLAPQNVYVRVTDTLGAYTNIWDGTARATGTLGGTTREISFVQRDLNVDFHSGIFDLNPATVLTPAGRYTFSLFHKETVDEPQPGVIEIPFRSYVGGRTIDIAPAPVVNGISPSVTLATTQAWTLTVNGTGFTVNSRIVLSGVTQTTTRFISSSSLAVELVGTPPGTLNVQVVSNTVKGVYSLPTMPLTIIDPLKTAFITLQNLPTQVIAGSSVPTFMITVTDSATGLPLNLINPSGRWRRKGKIDLPFVLIPTGATGVYSVMCTQPIVTEAGAYIPEIQADNAIAVRFTPQYPYMTVLGSDLASIKIEEFLSAPAPLYRDILPGHRQGDTLPRFLVRGYDQYKNLTAVPSGFALHRAATADAEEITISLHTRTVWRGVVEVFPTPLDSVGIFELIASNPPPMVALKNGANTTSAIPLLDEDGKPVSTLMVLPIEGEEDRFPKRPLPITASQPILLCANPYIVPTRTPSTKKIDPSTITNHPEALNRFSLDYSGGGKKNYSLVWSDEFDGTTLDATKWGIGRNAEFNEWGGSSDFQYGHIAKPENVVVGEGVLKLVMKELQTPEPGKANIKYSDANIDSRYQADFRYGKFVVKVKVPAMPFMHHGVWMGGAENGGPGLEADFPDCGNSPFPMDGDDTSIPNFGYTYNTNKHPRMALSIPGNDGNPYFKDTQGGDLSCAAPPDTANLLGLGGHMVEREYWMEWDRDNQGGYVKMGVTPIKADGTPDDARSQTIKWWGLQNNTAGSAQFIPEGQPRKENSAILGRYLRAAQKEEPFIRYSTWFYDYFPMNVHLDVSAYYQWAGGRCVPSNQSPDENNLPYATGPICTNALTQLRTMLAGSGQAMEVDYVRVYQRDVSARDLKPLILSGAHFTTDNTTVRLYKTTNDQDEFIELETRPWSQAELLVMLTSSNERWLNGTGTAFLRVANTFNGVTELSLPKRIFFDATEQASVRANNFSHRYAVAKPNPDATSPAFVLQEGNAKPNKPFSWVGYDEQLNIDLYNLPALGGTASNATTPPAAFTSLTRLATARAKWDVQVLNAAGQALGNLQTFPAGATNVNIGTVWRPEGTSKDRSSVDAGQYRAVRLTELDPETNNLVTAMGRYPSCADLLEVTAQITSLPNTIPSTAPTDQFDPVNMCGPFTIRYYLDPKPQVKITRRVQRQNGEAFSLEIGVELQPSAMMGNTSGTTGVANSGSTYQWQYRVLQGINNYSATGVPWQDITEGVFSDNFRMSGTFNINGANSLVLNDSVEVHCITTFPNATINTVIDPMCRAMNSAISGVVSVRPENANANFIAQAPPNNDDLTLSMAKNVATTQSKPQTNTAPQTHAQSDEETPPLGGKAWQSHTVNLLTAPNPAETQVGLRFRLPSKATTTIEIVDALQRTILAPMTATALERGEHELSLSVGTLPSGTYTVRVKALLANGALLLEQRPLIIVR